ncbi:MAG TPA: rhodanese-like domain-containing protein [Gemmatimonadota bacterium]|nr:rhodanese-like domain-containing protein [Gemmatimonadota bacterium]
MADTIHLRDLEKMIDRGDHFRLIEVEDADEYARGHIPGAVHLPPERVREGAAELLPDRNDRIVLYCRDERCEAARETASILDDMGYGKVLRFDGGKRAWVEAGHPLESD